ncbi:MAG TPA: MurR/RpiR family transcriptional regulator [Devosia sp.]|nr:MurR/RpiR family transcriptional regulator [Devosia sp.]
MSEQDLSIRGRLEEGFDNLTRAEKQLANMLVENYPASGLGSITELARKAGVSTPTVARLVQKLGYRGFSSFQQELRNEVAARISNPIQRHESWAGNAPDEHILNRFSDAVSANVRQTFSRIRPEQFDAVCALLADTDRSLRIVGGRISRSLADYFFTHMQVIRPDVTHMTSNSNAWPHYILDMKEGDILVMFDMRRYENDLRRLAEMAQERGVRIVLFTDQWGSPVSGLAHEKFNAHNEVPSAWDSSLVTMLLLEAIIAQVQQINWDQTRNRMKTLETLFDRTRMFRKFT